MPVILETKNLVKKYGDHIAVNEISFTIEEGEVFGLLGPNGAGKSTTISMLTCLFPPTSGSIRIYGQDVVKEAQAVKRLIGIVPQDLALYPTLNARDNLIFYGRMFGLGGADLRASCERHADESVFIAQIAEVGRRKPARQFHGNGELGHTDLLAEFGLSRDVFLARGFHVL